VRQAIQPTHTGGQTDHGAQINLVCVPQLVIATDPAASQQGPAADAEPARPRGLLEPCEATSFMHGSERGGLPQGSPPTRPDRCGGFMRARWRRAAAIKQAAGPACARPGWGRCARAWWRPCHRTRPGNPKRRARNVDGTRALLRHSGRSSTPPGFLLRSPAGCAPGSAACSAAAARGRGFFPQPASGAWPGRGGPGRWLVMVRFGWCRRIPASRR
jgi:hypothetical protein